MITKNLAAFLRVIRAGESNQNDDAFLLLNGGTHFDSFDRHPFEHLTTTHGGKASGAFQILPTTWDDYRSKTGAGQSFDPDAQTACALWLIERRGATKAIEEGRVAAACNLLRDEWVSLPGLGAAKAIKIFTQYGGTLQGEQPAAPIEDVSTTTRRNMDPLSLLTIFGPIISQLIPQVGKLFGGQKDQANVAAIGQVFQTIVDATKQSNVQGAVEAMQADKDLTKEVTKAIVTNPEVMPLLQIAEVGGGAAAAREADRLAAASDKPFYKTSAVFWVSVLLLPIVYWLVGSLIVGGVEIKPEDGWYIQLLKLFGGAWNGESRSGGFNLVIGLILGGICGVYYGVSVTQNKQQQAANLEK